MAEPGQPAAAGSGAARPIAGAAVGGRIAGSAVARRIAGAAALGAVVGAALAGIEHAAGQAERQACAGTDQICLGPAILGFAGGILLVVAGYVAGFAVLRVRPLILTVPAATVVTFLVMTALTAAVPGGPPPAAWMAAAILAAGLAFLALAATPGRSCVVGLALLAALLAGTLIIPRKVHDHLQLSEQRSKLAALGFPLMLPQVAGYKIASVYPVGNVLDVDMTPGRAHRDRWGAYEDIAFSVTIGAAAATGVAGAAGAADDSLPATLAPCLPGGPPEASGIVCHATGPDQWMISGGFTQSVIARHGDVLVLASSNLPGVPLRVLEQASTTLQHTTISALLAMK